MPAEVRWYDEQKKAAVILLSPPIVDWKPFDGAVPEVIKLVKEVNHDVVIIFDPANIPVPKGDPALPHLRRLLSQLPPNVKFVVTIMDNLGFFEKSLADILANVSYR